MGKLDGKRNGNFSKFYSRKKQKSTIFEFIINPKNGQPILEHDKKQSIMSVIKHVLNGLERANSSFISQYGLINHNRLKSELKQDFNVIMLYKGLSFFKTPTAEMLMEACTKSQYIGNETYLINHTPKELEKRLDYLYFSSLFILEDWLINRLPLIKATYLDTDVKKEILEQAVYIKANDTIVRLNEIYVELEKKFK